MHRCIGDALGATMHLSSLQHVDKVDLRGAAHTLAILGLTG